MVKYIIILLTVLVGVLAMGASDSGCGEDSSDKIQREQQEVILKEATAATGMPAIKNFRERKIMKDILEMRDQDGLVTYTYVFSEMTATWKFFCDSIGFGIPYATQYTNPEKLVYNNGVATLPQADPNGLFSPASAEGTWVLCKDPNGDDVRPVYIEPRVIVSPFKLTSDNAVAPPAPANKEATPPDKK